MMPPLPDLGCLADVTYTVRAENRSSGSPGNLELLFSLLTSLCLDHQTMAPASLRDWEVLPSPSDQGRQVSSCLPACLSSVLSIRQSRGHSLLSQGLWKQCVHHRGTIWRCNIKTEFIIRLTVFPAHSKGLACSTRLGGLHSSIRPGGQSFLHHSVKGTFPLYPT